jgi:hypothetical protein
VRDDGASLTTDDANAESSSPRGYDDGRYDAFIVWADARDDDRVEFQLAITTGAHKGDVVEIVATNFATRDPIDLVGLPCTLVVERGQPRIEP